VLTDEEVRHANSTDGLNILVWPTGPRADFENLRELFQGSQAVFFDAPWLQHQAASDTNHPSAGNRDRGE